MSDHGLMHRDGFGVISSPALNRAPEQGVLRRRHVIDGGWPESLPQPSWKSGVVTMRRALRPCVELVRIRGG